MKNGRVMAKNVVGLTCVFLHFLRGGPTCSDLAQILHTGSLGEVFRGEFSFGGPKMKNGRYMAIYGR